MPEPPAPDGVIRFEHTDLGDTIVLDRPARRNALTLAMWQDLATLVREHGGDTSRPLYLLGAGGYFCSGADLGALAHARSDADRSQTFVHAVVESLLTIHTVPREVVAVIENGAAGGGVEIMAACDRRVAIGAPTLVFPFGHHGMTLDDFTRWGLHHLVGDAAAERLVDGRHVVDFGQADDLGLFDEQHETFERFARSEESPAGRAGGESYLADGETVTAAIGRATAPMLTAFAAPS